MELVNKLPYDHPYRWDGTLFGAPKLWRPDELGASLSLWLDAEDTASITLNGSTVSQWNDKSGNGVDVLQASAASQPTYQATGLNSMPTLRFDTPTAGRYMQSSISFPIMPTGVSAMVVAQIDTPASWNGYVAVAPFATATESFAFYRQAAHTSPGTSSGNMACSANRSVPTFDYRNNWDSPPPPGAPHIACAIINGPTSADAYLSVNGGSNLPVSAAGNSGTFIPQSTDVVRVGIGYFNGSVSDSAIRGGISEVIMSASPWSTDDREKLEGYLAWKWGLEGDLPAGHPYKSAPPTV